MGLFDAILNQMDKARDRRNGFDDSIKELLTEKFSNSPMMGTLVDQLINNDMAWISEAQGSEDTREREITLYKYGVAVEWYSLVRKEVTDDLPGKKNSKYERKYHEQFCFHFSRFGYADLTYINLPNKVSVSVDRVMEMVAEILRSKLKEQKPDWVFEQDKLEFGYKDAVVIRYALPEPRLPEPEKPQVQKWF